MGECILLWSKLTTRLGTCLDGTAKVNFFFPTRTGLLFSAQNFLIPLGFYLAQPAQSGAKAFPDNFVLAHNPEVYATARIWVTSFLNLVEGVNGNQFDHASASGLGLRIL